MSNYPTNLTEKQWQVTKNIVEPQERNRKSSVREILNGIFYVNKSGCQWRMLPSDFAPWQTVYYYFRKWKLEGVWEELLNVLHAKARKSVGREESPSLGIIDSRSVKTSHHVDTDRGIDGNKKIKGRKEHIVVDTLGLPMAIKVHEANIHDSKGAKPTIENLAYKFPRLSKILADGGYQGDLDAWVKDNYEFLTETAEVMVSIAFIQIALNRFFNHFKTDSYGPWENTVYKIGGYCPVKWGQRSPYNDYCPIKKGERTLAGCVAVAVGQLMATHRYPSYYNDYSFDWNAMTSSKWAYHISEDAQHQISRLMQQLGRPKNLNMDYGRKKSGAKFQHSMRTLSNFGYTNPGELIKYDISQITGDLKAGYPVLCSGFSRKSKFEIFDITIASWLEKGHAWLLHGLLERKRSYALHDSDGSIVIAVR